MFMECLTAVGDVELVDFCHKFDGYGGNDKHHY